MTIFWKVDHAPTGRYRSFFKRSWPTGWSDRAETYPVATIRCADDYRPAKVRTGDHAPLKVDVAIRNDGAAAVDKGAFSWRTLKGEWKTVAEAKAASEKFYAEHRGMFMGDAR